MEIDKEFSTSDLDDETINISDEQEDSLLEEGTEEGAADVNRSVITVK